LRYNVVPTLVIHLVRNSSVIRTLHYEILKTLSLESICVPQNATLDFRQLKFVITLHLIRITLGIADKYPRTFWGQVPDFWGRKFHTCTISCKTSFVLSGKKSAVATECLKTYFEIPMGDLMYVSWLPIGLSFFLVIQPSQAVNLGFYLYLTFLVS